MESLSEVPERAATIQLLIAAAITRLDKEESAEHEAGGPGNNRRRAMVMKESLVLGVPYQVEAMCSAVEEELELLDQPKLPEQITRVVAVLRAFTPEERKQLINHCLELVEGHELKKQQASASQEELKLLALFRAMDGAGKGLVMTTAQSAWDAALGVGAEAKEDGGASGEVEPNLAAAAAAPAWIKGPRDGLPIPDSSAAGGRAEQKPTTRGVRELAPSPRAVVRVASHDDSLGEISEIESTVMVLGNSSNWVSLHDRGDGDAFQDWQHGDPTAHDPAATRQPYCASGTISTRSQDCDSGGERSAVPPGRSDGDAVDNAEVPTVRAQQPSSSHTPSGDAWDSVLDDVPEEGHSRNAADLASVTLPRASSLSSVSLSIRLGEVKPSQFDEDSESFCSDYGEGFAEL